MSRRHSTTARVRRGHRVGAPQPSERPRAPAFLDARLSECREAPATAPWSTLIPLATSILEMLCRQQTIARSAARF